MIGVLPIDKPEGFTSFDVIAKLRGILKIRRIGHSGTLDPMATGVLPVFIGRATRAIDLLPDNRKSYIAGFKLGFSTDTQDISGRTVKTGGKEASLQELQKILPEFCGEIIQIPPMYSAVKINGSRLYDLAREGKTVERSPRKISIFSLELVEFDPAEQSGIMNISCSKGTYIRTLINDIAKRLGSYGTMTSLRRTYSQGFDISSCLTLSEAQKAADEARLGSLILPIDRCFEFYERLDLNEQDAARYKNGVRILVSKPKGRYRIYSQDGFIGIGDVLEHELKTVKNFFGDDLN